MERNPVGVIFEHHLLNPIGDWDSCFSATMRDDFKEWLLDHVGFGYDYPVRGWDQKIKQAGEILEVRWAWYDDRRAGVDARKWKRHGFKILFLDSRHATLAKLTWGGRE